MGKKGGFGEKSVKSTVLALTAKYLADRQKGTVVSNASEKLTKAWNR